VESRPAVRVLNARDVIRDLDRLGEASDQLEAFSVIAGDIGERAAGRVHVYSGALRATITAIGEPNAAIVRAGDGLEYAGVVNYVRPGDEFLTGPANDELDNKLAKIIASIEALIRRFGFNR
jgi:hypothetical protein